MCINIREIGLSDSGDIYNPVQFPRSSKRQHSPFLQRHQGFQYHQEVPEGHQHLGVLRDLLDQEDQVDPT